MTSLKTINRIFGYFFIVLAIFFFYMKRKELIYHPSFDLDFYFYWMMITAVVYLSILRIKR